MNDASQHILDTIFDTLPSGMILFEPDGRVLRMNQKAKDILGLDPELPIDSINHHLPFYLSPLVNLLKGNTADIHRGEIVLSLPSRDEDSTLGYNLKQFTSAQHQPIKVLTFSDITQVLKDRLSMDKIKDELNQSKKLASIGTMIAGVAHELNNPLTGISMSTSLVKMNLERLKKRPELQATPNLTEHLDKALTELGKIAKTSEKAGVLVNDLLAYSKPTQLYLVPIPVHEMIQDIANALKSHPRFSQITLHVEGTTEHLVLGDRVKLEQVFYNLLQNACDATEGQGTLQISYDDTTEASSLASDRNDGKYDEPKRLIVIYVKDNGPGIDKTVINRIFDPFFTTKGHSGVGLGLSISYRTIEQHGGLLSVDSVKGEGTTFSVSLPIYSALDEDSEQKGFSS